MFKTELHCHSIDASPCSRLSASELVDIYIKAGYDTVVLTNHFSHFVYDHYKCQSVREYAEIFISAYEKMKESAGDRLTVLMGAEVRVRSLPNDFLIIGDTAEFLKSTENIFDMTVEELHGECKKRGWLLVQAHPFRNWITVVNPAFLDGIEVYNGHIGHEERNFIAEQWANEYGLIKTSGTDMHYDYVPASGGILTEEKITDMKMLADVLRSGRYELLKSDKVR